MKTFFRILGIGVAIIIAAVSCSEDINLSGGQDGKDGRDGVDGKDGYSIVTKIDTVFSNLGTILGFTISYYQDSDDIDGYSPGDKFQNSITTLNGTDGKDGQDGKDGEDGKDGAIPTVILRIDPPSEECPLGSIFMQSKIGEVVTGTISFCIPQGKDGYNLVQKYIEVSFYDGDEKITGTETRTYWDMDRDGEASEGDEYKGGFITWNGRAGKDGSDGKDGQNGKTPYVTFEIVEGFLVITSSIDGEIISQVSIELPKEGMNFSLIPFPSIQWLFDDGGSFEDWLDKGFSGDIDDIGTENSPNGNGTASGTGNGYFWTPELAEPCSVLAIEADIDSRKQYKVMPLLKLSDETIVNLGEWMVGNNPNFVSYDNSTYESQISYSVFSLEEIQDRNNVVQIGFYYEEIVDNKKSSSCDDPDPSWNDRINFDNIRFSTGKIVQN